MDTTKNKPTEQQTNITNFRWKLPEFRKNFTNKCLEGVLKQRGLPLTFLSILAPLVERYEVKLNADAHDEYEYCHWLSEKIKEVSHQKIAEIKSCFSNSTEEVFSAPEAGKSANIDWKEQVYQKVQKMKSAYFPKVYASCQQMNRALQQIGSSSQESNTVILEKLRSKIKKLEYVLALFRVNKCQITAEFKEILDKAEKFIQYNFFQRNASLNHQGRKHLSVLQFRQQSGPSQSSISSVKVHETKPSPQALGTQNYYTWKDVSQRNKKCFQENQVAKQYNSNSPPHENQLCIMKGPGDAVKKQTQGAQEATEAFSVGGNSREISASPLTQNCNKLKEISHRPTLNLDEPSAEVKHLLKVLTLISPEASRASVSEIRQLVHLNDVMPTSEFLSRPTKIAETGKNLASDIESFSQSRYVTCHDFVPTERKRSHSMNTMAAFDTSIISASSCHSFNQLVDAEKPDWTSVTYTKKKPRIVENCSLLEEIKKINNHLIDWEIVIGENDSCREALEGAAEESEGLIIEFLLKAVTVNQNLISHLSDDKKSIIKPLKLLVPTNYPFFSPIIVDEKVPEVSTQGQKDLSAIAKSKLIYSLQCLERTWSLQDIAMSWELCARETIVESAKAFGGGTFSSIYGEWEICENKV